MNKLRWNLIIVWCAATLLADGADLPERVKVTGDRVSLRARPNLNAELLDRAMSGDELVCLAVTNGWVAVKPPETISLWVAGEYVSNSVVTVPKLRVRAGPSENYSITGIIRKGDKVKLRGEFGRWLKIAPPTGTRVWISEQFVEPVASSKPDVSEGTRAPKPNPVALAEAEKKKAEEEKRKVLEEKERLAREIQALKDRLKREEMEKKQALIQAEKARKTEMSEEKEIPQAPRGTKPLVLKLDKSKPQNVYEEIPGVLQRANPGLYQLVLISGDIAEPICLVRGEKKQMESLLNRSLLIKGYVNWIEGVDLPVIRPVKIVIDPILEDF